MVVRTQVSRTEAPAAPVARAKPLRAKPKGRLPADPTHEDVLGLQATAGNQAVATMLQRKQTGAERLRSGPHETPGAKTVGGWADADPTGPAWNAAGHLVGGVRRIPVDGLTVGLDQQVRGGASKSLTSEAADHRAIVVLPGTLRGSAPVDVLIHLHGYAEDATSRPYAGWRQHGGGGVRDVDLDRVEQQLDAVNQPRLIGVLPQGGEKSQFGDIDFAPYLTDVLRRLVELKALGAAPALGRVILGAHSGGGHTVRAFLDAQQQKKRGKGRIGEGRLGEVVLFEAINSPGELASVWGWVESELNRLLGVVTSNAAGDVKDAAVADAPRLSGFSRSSGGYGVRYGKLKDDIEGWHARHGGELGAWRERIADLHRVVWTGVEHEKQVRERLDDALRALDAPSSDRIAASTGAAKPATSGQAPSAGFDTAALRVAAAAMIGKGQRDETDLTDALFAIVHPELGGKAIPAGQTTLQQHWLSLRSRVVRPALAAVRPATTTTPAGPVTAPATKSAPAPAGKAKGKKDKKVKDTGPTPAQVAAHPAEAAEWDQLKDRVKAAFPGGFARYLAVRGLYAKRLKGETPVAWLNALDFDFEFCGQHLAGLDPRLTARLTAVQDEAAAIIAEVRAAGAPVAFQGAFQPRPTTDKPDSLSDHALGLALHLNYKNNPYIGRKGKTSSAAAVIIEKIAAGAGHDDFWKSVGAQKKQSAHDRIVTNYHAYATVSDAVAAYFRAMDKLEGQELEDRKAEYAVVKSANAGRDPKNGFYLHTANTAGDPMLKLVLLLAEKAGLQWGGIYNSRPKDLHHFALKGV
jgi:hypothetical protein